ncbi:hypothetical protein GCM10027517_21550 [Phycicoccus ginsengisoli]
MTSRTMSLTPVRVRTTAWLTTHHPAGLLYGAVITGAVLGVTAGHGSAPGRVVAKTLVVVAVYYWADVYVRAFAEQFHEARSTLPRRLLRALAHESSVLLGAAPATVTYLLAVALGVGSSRSADFALWLTVVLLGLVAYLAARRVGVRRKTALVEGALAAPIGVLMIAAKALLH